MPAIQCCRLWVRVPARQSKMAPRLRAAFYNSQTIFRRRCNCMSQLRLPRASRLQGMSATNKTRFHMPDGLAQRERDAEMARGVTDWSRAAIAWLFAHDAELIEVQ